MRTAFKTEAMKIAKAKEVIHVGMLLKVARLERSDRHLPEPLAIGDIVRVVAIKEDPQYITVKRKGMEQLHTYHVCRFEKLNYNITEKDLATDFRNIKND